ncbi:MAG: hypothetical protein JWL62_336 [Hyphomicrobiales bacterium]|nr:hypothetical protein [Hyphomicrobiales bacterium]
MTCGPPHCTRYGAGATPWVTIVVCETTGCTKTCWVGELGGAP